MARNVWDYMQDCVFFDMNATPLFINDEVRYTMTGKEGIIIGIAQVLDGPEGQRLVVDFGDYVFPCKSSLLVSLDTPKAMTTDELFGEEG